MGKNNIRRHAREGGHPVLFWTPAFAGVTFLLCFFAGIAQAEDVSVNTFCRLLPEYRPAQGVEYQPGVDVHGQFVAPADLPGQSLKQFESIEIPVEIDLIEKFGLSVPAAVELKPAAALISIHNDGRVDYNGQDISRQAHKACEKR